MKVDLGTTMNINSSYSGKASAGYLSAALLAGKTLSSNVVDIRDNIAYKEVIQVLSSDANLIKPGSCDFSPSGTLTESEITLTPAEIMVNLEVCAKNFRSSWESLQMKGINSKLPQSFGQFILEHVVLKTAAAMETAVWQGTQAGDIPFDGFEVLANASAAAGTGVTLVAKAAVTPSNVTSELGKLVTNCPDTIYGSQDVFLYLPTAIYKNYVTSLGGFGAAGTSNVTSGFEGKGQMWYRNQQELYFDGIPVVHCPGMTSTDAILTTKSNLIFGTSLYSDLNNVSIIDQGPITGSQNSRVILRGSAGAVLGIKEEIVLYS